MGDLKTLADLKRYLESLDGTKIRVKIQKGESLKEHVRDILEKEILLER